MKAIEGEVIGLDKTVNTQERKLNSLHGSMGDAAAQVNAIGSKLDSTTDEIASSKAAITNIAQHLAEDRQKISKISGVLEGAVNEFSQTQNSLK